MDLSELEKKINYIFKDKNLLKRALTHTSYAYENKVESYERLEYLGDSILEFIASKFLYMNYHNLSEGEMTKVRADSVCEDSLYNIALKLDFSDFLYLGRSEKASHGLRKAILADTVESVIAAMYLDSDIETVEKFIIENIKDQIEYASKHVGVKDYKSVLQELLQKDGDISIKYNIISEKGPDHDKQFTAEVVVDNKRMETGVGRSKKAAEMEAARKTLEILNKGDN